MRNNKLFIIATALSIIFVVLLGIIVFSSVQVVEDATYDMAAPSPSEASVSTGLISADPSVLSGPTEAGDTGNSSAADAEEKSDGSAKEAAKADSDASSEKDTKADSDTSSKKDERTASDASSKKDDKADSDASPKKDSKTDSDASPKKDSKTDSDASSGKDDKTDSKSSSGKKGKTDSDASSGKDKETASSAASVTDALSDQAAYAAAQLLRSKNDPAFWAGCPARNVQLLTINPYSRCGDALTKLLTINPYSRCGDALTTVTTLVIHYVGNAGTSAMDNREYFEDLKDTHITSASSHFIISMDGEIVQCIPLSEVAYASNDRNNDTIAIECCHPEADGKFSDATYASLVELSAFLCKSFHINPQELLRHYDVSGKLCPLYYVEHPDEWQELKDRIEARTDELLAEEEDVD